MIFALRFTEVDFGLRTEIDHGVDDGGFSGEQIGIGSRTPLYSNENILKPHRRIPTSQCFVAEFAQAPIRWCPARAANLGRLTSTTTRAYRRTTKSRKS